MSKVALGWLAIVLAVFPLLAGCGLLPKSGPPFHMIVASENQPFEFMLTDYAKSQGVDLQITYSGSVDVMRELDKGDQSAYDGVWPSNSIWITLGDSHHVVKHQASVMRSPVVLGVKQSVAQRLGWIGRDVTVDDILTAAEAGNLRFMTTSATQSNSGSSAYLGFLYAFAGHPEVLTSANLHDPAVQAKIKRILGAVNRSAGSSGWLKDLFLQHYDSYDAMVNYEAVAIEANQQLTKENREPLYVVYPVDGLAIADYPLGYIDKGDSAKEAFFLKLEQYLLAPDAQAQFLQSGRRTGALGVNPAAANRQVFNPAWGIDTQKVLTPIRYPPPDVILEALSLYQTTLRKPSLTVFALDFSGSMAGQRESDLKSAMALLLDQDVAKNYLLQASADDVTVVVTFSDHVMTERTVVGNDPTALRRLLSQVQQQSPSGGTDIYTPIMRGYSIIQERGYANYAPSIILMTDGQSNTGASLSDLNQQLTKQGIEGVPVYAIQFGEASPDQLNKIATLTSGRVFDGRTDLIGAFREAKGYND